MEGKQAAGYKQLVELLPDLLRRALEMVPEQEQGEVTEIRLRAARPVVLMKSLHCLFLGEDGSLTRTPERSTVVLEKSVLSKAFLQLCNWAVHTKQRELNLGYIGLPGGHRAGIGSTGLLQDGVVAGQREIHSLNLRIARQVYGAANDVLRLCFRRPGTGGVLLAGAPGSGKTTVLRDAARQLAGERWGYRKVAVVDETGEIAGVTPEGVHNDLGVTSDLILGYPKDKGLTMALRYLSPQIIICDEVAEAGEIDGIVAAANSGVGVMTSIHAGNMEELRRKHAYKRLMEVGAVRYAAVLSGAERPCMVGEVLDLWQEKCLFRADTHVPGKE